MLVLFCCSSLLSDVLFMPATTKIANIYIYIYIMTTQSKFSRAANFTNNNFAENNFRPFSATIVIPQ